MGKVKNYTLRQIIGEGATSTVYRATSEDGKEVAVKIIPKGERSAGMAYKEMEVLGEVRHENIVEVLGRFESSRHIYLVEELCDLNLITFLNEYEVDENIALKVLRMILCGVRHMHARGIIHRDIKLGNILLQGNTAKICDFGLSCYSHESSNTFCGTVDYIAPEMGSGQRYSLEVDMWSVGAVFYVLLTKKKFTQAQDVPKCSLEVMDLLYRLLEEDPGKRITAEDALRHRCFDRFMPLYQDYRYVPDFSRSTKHGVIRKVGNRVKLNNIEVVMDVREGDTYCLGRHRETGCVCHGDAIYLVFANGEPTMPQLLTNGELKTLSFVMAYVKMVRERTPKIVIEEGGSRFYYTLSNDFVYTTETFTLKKKNRTYEVVRCSGGKTNKVTYSDVPLFARKEVLRLSERCRELDANTCWSVQSPPMLINCSDHQQLSMSCISQVSEISLKNRVVYKHMEDVGWCIKTGLVFMCLLNDGERLEVLGKDLVVVYHDRRYQINNRLPMELKCRLKRMIPLLKRFLG